MNCQKLRRIIINFNIREYKKIVSFRHVTSTKSLLENENHKNLMNIQSCSHFSSNRRRDNNEDILRFSSSKNNLPQHGMFTKLRNNGLLMKTNNQGQFQSSRHFSDLPVIQNKVQGSLRILVDSPPVEFVQNSLIWLHSTTGLPWWAIVILTTFTTRTIVTLPAAIYQHHMLGRISLIKLEMDDVVKHLKREASFKVQELGWPESKARIAYGRAVKKQWDEFIIRDNCHPMKGMVLILTQLPIWILLSAGFRNLCFILPQQTPLALKNYQDLSVEGFGWISNLTVVDCYLILPISLGILNLINIELQTILRNKDIQPTKVSKIALNVGRFFSIVMVGVAGIMPSCISLYWTTSSLYSMMQTLMIVSPKVRRFVGIPNTEAERNHPYRHLYNSLKNRIPLKNTQL